MTRILFRGVRLLIFRSKIEPKIFSRVEIGEVIEELHVKFTVEKSLDKAPNPAEITIDNMNEDSRRLVARSPVACILEAGYDGQLERVCQGDVRWSSSRIVGTEWQTMMQVADGGRAFARATISKGYGKGTPMIVGVRDALQAMGVEVPPEVLRRAELQRHIASGDVAHGRASDELSRWLDPLGLSWSIQDGRIVILGPSDVLPKDTKIISEDTGMIGSPEQGKPDKDGKPPTWTVKTALRPDFMCGQRVHLKARDIEGNFRIERVKHDGDNLTNDFATELEIKPV